MLFWNAAALAVGAAMDAAFGDPRNMLHMVVVFGKVISFWEKILYNMKNKRVAGLLLEKGVRLTARIVPNGTHCEASWEKQIPFFLPTLLYELEE